MLQYAFATIFMQSGGQGAKSIPDAKSSPLHKARKDSDVLHTDTLEFTGNEQDGTRHLFLC